jgi:hypothetical protein
MTDHNQAQRPQQLILKHTKRFNFWTANGFCNFFLINSHHWIPSRSDASIIQVKISTIWRQFKFKPKDAATTGLKLVCHVLLIKLWQSTNTNFRCRSLFFSPFARTTFFLFWLRKNYYSNEKATKNAFTRSVTGWHKMKTTITWLQIALS